MSTQKNPFNQFTNLYELQKTLRFELRPVPETKKLLEKGEGKNLIQMDLEIDRLYEKEMKPMFNILHEKFINESLGLVKLDCKKLKKLENLLAEADKLRKQIKEGRKNKNNISEVEKRLKIIIGDNSQGKNKNGEIAVLQDELRVLIVKAFNLTADKWKKELNNKETLLPEKKGKRKIKIKKSGPKILQEENVLAILAYFNPDKADIIKKFAGFFTYFSGFNQNRANYYTVKALATGVANRAINRNFLIFLANRKDFARFKERLPRLAEFDNYFELENYEKYLSQTGIEEYNDQIGKIKQIVNLEHNQQQKDNKFQLKGLATLEKQIGCRTKKQREEGGDKSAPKFLEKVGLGFQVSQDDDGEYLIWECLNYINKELAGKLKSIKDNYQKFFADWRTGAYDLEKIWFRKEALNTISGRWFGGNNWFIIGKALALTGVGKFDKRENTYKIPEFVSLAEIKTAFEMLENGVNYDFKKSKKKKEGDDTDVVKYSADNLFKEEYKKKGLIKNSLFETMLAVWQSEIKRKFEQIFDGYKLEKDDVFGRKKGEWVEPFIENFQKVSQEKFDRGVKDENGRSIHTEVVKNLIEEGYLRLFQLTKYHNLDKKGERDPRPFDGNFYATLDEFWKDNIVVVYHKALQSTLTKKPYSEDKIKLNFENGSLLGGFSDGQERSKAGVVLKNKNKFYLGILIDRGFFRTDKANPVYDNAQNNEWERLILTNLKFQTLAGKGFLGKHGVSYGEMGKDNPMMAVEYLQKFIKLKYLDKYPALNEVAHKKYTIKKEFDADVKNALKDCFTMNFKPVDFGMIRQGLTESLFYLFEIVNKDISSQAKNGKNVHTLYWEALFGDQNLKKPILALNGGAEIFYRESQREKLEKKLDKSGKEVLDHKRYGQDKYFLHASITINYGQPKNIKFKEVINEKISQNADRVNIIGIDRGEKHLLYYSVVSPEGVLLEQGSFNQIETKNKVDIKAVKAEYGERGELKKVELVPTGKKVKYVDYQILLDYYEKKRNLARRDWQTIGKIKDLKDGYLSQTVHRIYQLILKYNAVVAMEDLNVEFKAKRAAKVEKSVYKNFEMALAKKLNHLILKDRRADEIGGALRAYQLTPAIPANDVGKFDKAKQWGIMFYVRANYTSTTDPLTGWRKHKYISNSEKIDNIQKFFSPGDGIQIDYDTEKQCFKFSYDHELEGGAKKHWELFACDGLERFYWDNRERQIKKYNLYEEFEKLLGGLRKEENINIQIDGVSEFRWKDLVFFWNLLNQIRNTDRSAQGDENDFLQSPVWSEKYNCFYDSRKAPNNMPNNGDANGAFNIARKGQLILERIKKCSDIPKFGNDNNGKNPENNYFISDADWDKFAQK
ncbi:type V CRISPR-associated protein Cpf1 [Candidatus Falkowbacteria bacterium CG11_big_fil_rev_8_21_14_0_20_39_10]|uniref:Type V CRISPR-associated protein Cpf1 n=1 Tax=Candidatus Falkowbacteria bacterium CG11_big_fil_rev_8_21_14_0_20_39_10 TaxID=1974570 RepID=A0A2M6K9N7_9BACT|nr:MAG: type V CRISPR-associated protein Cpf1 [Candidatus Falkowbacteria bacterium CG11_big_fil_rev_8_21_14_0_20_39_10]